MRSRARSMKYLRDLGMPVDIAERWNMGAKKRQDLFGIFDLVAMSLDATFRTEGQIVGIQCVNTKLKEHLAKLEASELAADWVACGGGIEIHSWAKRCKDGRGTRKAWKLNRIEFRSEKYVQRCEKETAAGGFLQEVVQA